MTPTTLTTMQPDPLAEALDMLGDAAARGEIEAAVERFHKAERLRHAGPRLASRLEAIAAASSIVAEAAGDADLLDALDPCVGILPTSDPEALAAAGAVELEAEVVADFGILARTAAARLDKAMAGPSSRWQLLVTLAGIWVARGHHLGTSPRGLFMQFAVAVGEAVGVEVTHHSVRQVCERYREMEARSHTARPAIAA